MYQPTSTSLRSCDKDAPLRVEESDPVFVGGNRSKYGFHLLAEGMRKTFTLSSCYSYGAERELAYTVLRNRICTSAVLFGQYHERRFTTTITRDGNGWIDKIVVTRLA